MYFLHASCLTFIKTGTPGIPYFERFNIVDNEKIYKQSVLIEGGYVDLGFNFYRIRFEVIEKDEKLCITKFTGSYEVKDMKPCKSFSRIITVVVIFLF